jgi:hypothetical protein
MLACMQDNKTAMALHMASLLPTEVLDVTVEALDFKRPTLHEVREMGAADMLHQRQSGHL